MAKMILEYDARNKSWKNRKVRRYLKDINDVYSDELLIDHAKKLGREDNVEKLVYTRGILDNIISIYFGGPLHVSRAKRLLIPNPDEIIYNFIIGTGMLKYKVIMDNLEILYSEDGIPIEEISKILSIIDKINIPFEKIFSTIYSGEIVYNGKSTIVDMDWTFDIVTRDGRREYYIIPEDLDNVLLDFYIRDFFENFAPSYDYKFLHVGSEPGDKWQMEIYSNVQKDLPTRVLDMIDLKRDMMFNIKTFKLLNGKTCRTLPILNTETNELNLFIAYYDEKEGVWYSKGTFFEYIKEEFNARDLVSIYIQLVFDITFITSRPNFNIKLKEDNI